MTANYVQAVADHVIDLFEEAGRPIALMEVIPRPSHLLIENVAVLPDHHGKGIGGLLLKRAETIARSLGFNELRLYAKAMFAANTAFYAHRGFEDSCGNPMQRVARWFT
jgi:GNAT superfamily N-acetyltransferase